MARRSPPSQGDVTRAAGAAAAAGAVAAAGAIVKRKRDAAKEPRSYRLLADEPLPEGIARVARGRIDHALDELRGKTDSDAEEAVHEARKDMKKLRALLRVARAELGDEVYRRENECFRDAARRLSGVRDADVMLGTLDGLDGVPEPLREALEAHRESLRAAGAPSAAAEVIIALEQARERVDEWPLERDGFEAIEDSLRRIYRRGRRCLRAVEDEPSTENLHEWRKRAKDHWYDLNLLRDAWPELLEAAADEAHVLSDRLGEDHDLAVLHEWAHENAAGLDLMRLDEAVEQRRAELQAEALELGRRLYAERPRAFVARLGRYWSAWRAGAVPTAG